MNPLAYVAYRLNDLRFTNAPKFYALSIAFVVANAAVDIGLGFILGAVVCKYFFC